MKKIFEVIEPTVQNMNAIAEFNRIVMNFLKMKRLGGKDGK